MSVKTERISDMLVEKISYIIATEVKDADINFVTITDVKIGSDLSYAKVYFTTLDDSKRKSTVKALRNARGFIRSKLFGELDIRNIPELEFVYDESIEYGNRIDDIINNLNVKGE
jgi:ribosome-binding factor A